MICQIKDVYLTYRGDSGRHKLRIFSAISLSIFIGLLGRPVVEQAFPAISLIVSVLTGFTFTALFSEPSVRITDLPAPRNEDDRRDVADLKELGKNFRKRANLFLTLAVIELLIITVISVKPEQQNVTRLIPQAYFLKLNHWLDGISFFEITMAFGVILTAMSIFLFLEYLYTFYRMSETILAILNMRVRYLDDRTDAS